MEGEWEWMWVCVCVWVCVWLELSLVGSQARGGEGFSERFQANNTGLKINERKEEGQSAETVNA